MLQGPTYEVSGSSTEIVPAGIMRGRGRLEGNALAYTGDFVGGRGSKAVVTSPIMGGQGTVSVSMGGTVGGHGVKSPIMGGRGQVSVSMGGTDGGHVEGKAGMSVVGRGLNGASGGTSVYAGSRFRRPVKERLGSMEHFSDIRAETKKVGGLFFIFACYVLNFRCL